MAAPAPRQNSSDLGRYEVLFRLAAGGMAEVFVARQRGEGGFERAVAIKRMLAHLADDDRFVAMFLDEARLAAYISSPNVVSTLDVDLDENGAPFIVMDLVIGLTLAQILRAAGARQTHIPTEVAIEILSQAADGLHAAHDAITPTGLALQIVHRDVSPQNVLVGIDGRARISDFGVARALARITKTSTGEFKGKISYFSPEQAEGRELDRRSDIFSLGIVAWETFIGARLFKSDNPLTVLDSIRSMEIPLISDLRPDVPLRVAQVVAKALERDVNKRYADARAFGRDLQRAAEGLPTQPDPRAVGAYVKDISGNVLDQMAQKISDAFSRNSVLDADGNASLASVQSQSKLRFLKSRTGELEELASDPPPPAPPSGEPTSVVRSGAGRRPTGDAPAGSTVRPGSRVGKNDLAAAAAKASPRGADSVPPERTGAIGYPENTEKKSKLPLIIGGAVALIGVGAAAFYFASQKPVEQTATPLPAQPADIAPAIPEAPAPAPGPAAAQEVPQNAAQTPTPDMVIEPSDVPGAPAANGGTGSSARPLHGAGTRPGEHAGEPWHPAGEITHAGEPPAAHSAEAAPPHEEHAAPAAAHEAPAAAPVAAAHEAPAAAPVAHDTAPAAGATPAATTTTGTGTRPRRPIISDN